MEAHLFRVFRRLKYTQTHSQSNIVELKYWICHFHRIISHSSLPLPSLLLSLIIHSLMCLASSFSSLISSSYSFLPHHLSPPYSPPSPSLELVLVGLILTPWWVHLPQNTQYSSPPLPALLPLSVTHPHPPPLSLPSSRALGATSSPKKTLSVFHPSLPPTRPPAIANQSMWTEASYEGGVCLCAFQDGIIKNMFWGLWPLSFEKFQPLISQ